MRKRNEELGKKKNTTSVEPFWQDFNSTITEICREKVNPLASGSSRRGPSNPTRNKQMNLTQTVNTFKFGQDGGVGSGKNRDLTKAPISHRDKLAGKLQPIKHLRAGQIESRKFKKETDSTTEFRDGKSNNIYNESILTVLNDQANYENDHRVVIQSHVAESPE